MHDSCVFSMALWCVKQYLEHIRMFTKHGDKKGKDTVWHIARYHIYNSPPGEHAHYNPISIFVVRVQPRCNIRSHNYIIVCNQAPVYKVSELKQRELNEIAQDSLRHQDNSKFWFSRLKDWQSTHHSTRAQTHAVTHTEHTHSQTHKQTHTQTLKRTHAQVISINHVYLLHKLIYFVFIFCALYSS